LNQYRHKEEARSLLEYYFERFVRMDGTIDYYGTALSEYGEMLSMAAAVSEGEDGNDWLRRNAAPVKRMLGYLLDCMNLQMLVGGQSGLGPNLLLYGSPEADTRSDRGEYFHISMLVLRGFEDIAPLLCRCVSRECWMEVRNAAHVLQKRIEAACDRVRGKFAFLPHRMELSADIKSFTESRDVNYANYRYYPEMLGSGVMEREDALKIVEARETLGGEVNGMTILGWPGYAHCFDNWPIAAYARGLLELEERGRFMKLMAGHFKTYQSPDTYMAYENVTWAGESRYAHADWCIPAQLVFPRMLAWSYCFKKRDCGVVSWNGPDESELANML